MNQENKELLLKDLCGRLPYGVLMNGNLTNSIGRDNINFVLEPTLLAAAIACGCKPYLRPMSSMTLEEECEFCRLFECDSVNAMYGYINWVTGGSCDYDDFDIEFSKLAKIMDWLNTHHFDYRGLIPKGLALEAPEGMYNIK